MKLYISILFFWCGIVQAEQFLYPVAALDPAGQELLVVHQKSLDDIELWIWNAQTKYAYKGLLSAYMPAGIKMLPSGLGFSFIDQGRLRVKMFAKRSPRTIAMYEPIRNISEIHWISDDAFYFSAQEGDVFNIFSCSTLGELHRLTASECGDYLYPQKVGNELFCIFRNQDTFNIVVNNWTLSDFDSKSKVVQSQKVLSLDNSAAYLHMISAEQGFYLEYPQVIDSQQETIEFVCHQIKKCDGAWSDEMLFSFRIPCEYILGTESKRLYESVQPFLPNYTSQDLIVFVDAQDHGLQLQCYNLISRSIDVFDYTISRSQASKSVFAPFVVENKVFTGIISHDERVQSSFVRSGDFDGIKEFELPSFEL
ncbi:hypothetical protein EBR77_00250 [bacterium]|nr:hypothetical protein [bacterium]NBX78231.1 hypothetical protein [bacterium]